MSWSDRVAAAVDVLKAVPTAPAGRSAIGAALSGTLRAVRFALPPPNEGFEKLVGTPLEDLSTADPTRVLYDALLPFAVAALELFFCQSFKVLLHYDPSATKHLRKQTRKIELADALAIAAREKTIEDVVADWYSFQNIASIHGAFNEWFGLKRELTP